MPKKFMDIEREAWFQPLDLHDSHNIPIQEPIHHAMVEWNKGSLSKITVENIDKLDDWLWKDLQEYLQSVLKTRDFDEHQEYESQRIMAKGLSPQE